MAPRARGHGGAGRADRRPAVTALAAMTQPPPDQAPARKHVRLQERGSPQTSSAPKTWIFLAMPPRTDIRPSCQVRTAVGLGWRRSEGKTQPQPGGGCPTWGLFF
uniref:Uncharacterized protein n=1 Tax=Capra hircus TaxID=9925 RepID=A0A8C2RXT7_CAPHI